MPYQPISPLISCISFAAAINSILLVFQLDKRASLLKKEEFFIHFFCVVPMLSIYVPFQSDEMEFFGDGTS